MKYKYSNKNGYVSKLNQSDYTDIYSDDKKSPDNGYIDIYSSERKKDRKRNRKKIPWTKIFSLITFISLGLIGALLLYAYKSLHSFKYENDITINEPQEDLANDSMILNVLLIGSDSMSVGDGGRSDSMILVSLDARHKKIKLTSLMRDIWVDIPGHGQDRLNASYAYGGPSLTIETIGKNFGILVDRYAVVDFEGFSQIIDTLGGIDLMLTADECAYINKYSADPNTLRGSGMKHLTGLQALHYSRDRNSIGSDYDRTGRQRTLLKAVVEKMKTANIAQITELIAKIGPLITTNFKSNEISRMATHSMTYLKYPTEEFRLPTDDNVRNETYSGKMVLVINNTAKAKQDIYNFIYEPDPNSLPPVPKEVYNTPTQKSATEKTETPKSKETAANQSATDANKTNSQATKKPPANTANSTATNNQAAPANAATGAAATAQPKSATTESQATAGTPPKTNQPTNNSTRAASATQTQQAN